MRTTPVFFLRLLLTGILTASIGCNGDGDTSAVDGSVDSDSASPCPWDEDDTPQTAGALTLGGAVEGYICPKGDQDWYKLTIPAGVDLVTVNLSLFLRRPVNGLVERTSDEQQPGPEDEHPQAYQSSPIRNEGVQRGSFC